jgi:protein-S-isoprenylcysteine O-methyltransferase
MRSRSDSSLPAAPHYHPPSSVPHGCRFEPARAGFDSFLLNQNWPDYQRAVAAGVAEFALECWLAPGWKAGALSTLLFAAGCMGLLAGQAVRTVGMWTTGSSFAHQVATRHGAAHRLVTGGIYRYLRHPAYCGWFYWSIATQLVLGNPLCAVAYGAVSWSFFSQRIPHEEQALVSTYGAAYHRYARATPICIPGVRGIEAYSEADLLQAWVAGGGTPSQWEGGGGRGGVGEGARRVEAWVPRGAQQQQEDGEDDDR